MRRTAPLLGGFLAALLWARAVSAAPVFDFRAPDPSAAGGGAVSAALIGARVQDLGIAPAQIISAIAASADLAELQNRFEASGLLKPAELDLGKTDDALALRYAVQRLWAEAPASSKPEVSVDESRALPAIEVSAQGRRYLIYGIVHGKDVPLRPHAVHGLVDGLKKEGAMLYSEQNLPAHYGYAFGRETLDHKAAAGARAELRDASPGRVIRPNWIDGLLSRAALASWRSDFERNSRSAKRADEADYYRRLARTLAAPEWDIKEAVAASLPMPLAAVFFSDYGARSAAMARAIAADAVARGLREAHILVGFLHAPHIAWHLARLPPTELAARKDALQKK